MQTKNNKTIGCIMLLFGIGLAIYASSFVYKMLIYPQKGEVKTATIIGFKVSSNGARMVQSNKTLSGRSPYFTFRTSEKQSIKTYSKSPQLFMLSNYEIGEKITVAFPHNEPQKAIVLSWKEIPGLLLLFGLGILSIVIGKEFLFKA